MHPDLPAQDRAPLTAVGGVVLGQDRGLELSGEAPPLRLVSTRGHDPIIGADISSRHRHLNVSISRPVRGQ